MDGGADAAVFLMRWRIPDMCARCGAGFQYGGVPDKVVLSVVLWRLGSGVVARGGGVDGGGL